MRRKPPRSTVHMVGGRTPALDGAMMLQSLPVHPDVHVLQLESPAHAEPGQDRTTRGVWVVGGGGVRGQRGKGGGGLAVIALDIFQTGVTSLRCGTWLTEPAQIHRRPSTTAVKNTRV